MLGPNGGGKTTLLERTLRELSASQRVAALVGDLATDCDAAKLARSGAPVRQITTGTVCHLDAAMVDSALADWNLATIDLLFIENVGNLVCPASYDLGEDRRVVLMSVTEGEDKPRKYPGIFNSADLAVITKYDLAVPCEFDLAAGLAQVQALVADGARLKEASADVAAATGLSRRDLYQAALAAKAPRPS